ncbi:MAG: hypothetical protein LBD50_01635 [Rickettsiales bacterium]|nr:hypothetical protein [Rickettsiales bacterium]
MFYKIISKTKIEPAPRIQGAIINFHKMPEEHLNGKGYFRLVEDESCGLDDAKEYYQSGNVIKARVKKNAKYDYRAKRAAEYPPVSDIMDALLKSMDGDDEELSTIIRRRRETKLKYPKPATV